MTAIAIMSGKHEPNAVSVRIGQWNGLAATKAHFRHSRPNTCNGIAPSRKRGQIVQKGCGGEYIDSAAQCGEITFKNDRVEQANFNTYRVLRINEAPAIEVYMVQSSEPPGGIGETGTSAIVPRSATLSSQQLEADCAKCRPIPACSSALATQDYTGTIR